MSRARSQIRWLVLALSLGAASLAPQVAASAEPTLGDYKYFRSLCIDLLGRMPTESEIAAFERPGFDLDKWIDQALRSEDYADRMTRIYADLLRPQVPSFQVGTNRNTLARILIKDDTGKDVYVYFRPGQRRTRHAEVPKSTDPSYPKWNNLVRGGFCLLEDETGLKYPDVSGGLPPVGTAKPVEKAVLDKYTTVVRPWWLYADYKAPVPSQRYNPAEWATRFPGYVPTNDLLKDPDTKDTVEIRVCKEEAAAALSAPMDADKTKTVACLTGYGAATSLGCGCGPGLEWCMPAAHFLASQPRATFMSSRNVLLGVDDPTDQVGFEYRTWQMLWIAQEPQEFLRNLFAEDRDFREVVTGRHTFVNGPLAQFYRFSARANWNDADLGQTPLPAPESLPADLLPHDVMTWKRVADRGPNAAGLLTMPLFLYKNSTRRARGHVVYNMFLCRDFVAPAGLQLPISKEPNLMKREGCAACHQTLEPLSAYFSRLVEGEWSWLDPKLYPTENPACKKPSATGTIPSSCNTRYDNTFSTTSAGVLRGAYGSIDNASEGPAGLGRYLAAKPEFAECAAQNVATSFLGRELRSDDAELLAKMASALTQSGYRMRSMMKVLLSSPAYRSANNLASTVWRNGGGK